MMGRDPRVIVEIVQRGWRGRLTQILWWSVVPTMTKRGGMYQTKEAPTTPDLDTLALIIQLCREMERNTGRFPTPLQLRAALMRPSD